MKIFALLLYYSVAQYLPTQPALGWQIAYAIRRILAKYIFAQCGKNVIVKKNAYFGKGTGITIGDNSQIGERSQIGAYTRIGRDVIMAPDVIIWTMGHAFDRTDIPINQQGATEIQSVNIGDDVWIGQRAIIKPGVTVGNHAIIGAGSIVTKDIPEWAIVAGNPARIIRMRK